jgi:hypothetical protein
MPTSCARRVPECKRREKPVDLTSLGPVGVRGAPGDPGAPAPAGQLIDAAGQRFAPRVFSGEGLSTVFRLGNVVVGAGIHAGGFPEFVRLHYEAPDCGSAPFVRIFDSHLVRPISFMGSTAYYPGDPIASHDTMSYAEAESEGDCMTDGGTFNGGLCCFDGSDTIVGGPAVAVDVSGLISRFPLSIAVVP